MVLGVLHNRREGVCVFRMILYKVSKCFDKLYGIIIGLSFEIVQYCYVFVLIFIHVRDTKVPRDATSTILLYQIFLWIAWIALTCFRSVPSFAAAFMLD
jgi:hypothetical protein